MANTSNRAAPRTAPLPLSIRATIVAATLVARAAVAAAAQPGPGLIGRRREQLAPAVRR